MQELTQSLLNAIDTQPQPMRVVDPRTRKEYILVAAEDFERLVLNLQERLDVQGAAVLLDEVARREGWDDPDMDIYNDLAPGRS